MNYSEATYKILSGYAFEYFRRRNWKRQLREIQWWSWLTQMLPHYIGLQMETILLLFYELNNGFRTWKCPLKLKKINFFKIIGWRDALIQSNMNFYFHEYNVNRLNDALKYLPTLLYTYLTLLISAVYTQFLILACSYWRVLHLLHNFCFPRLVAFNISGTLKEFTGHYTTFERMWKVLGYNKSNNTCFNNFNWRCGSTIL